LLQAIHEVATGQTVCKPHRIKSETAGLKRAIQQLTVQLEATFSGLPNARWVAMRLLDGDERIIEAVKQGELGDLSEAANSLEMALEVAI
jgi:ferrous iron transport protein B